MVFGWGWSEVEAVVEGCATNSLVGRVIVEDANDVQD